VRLWVAVVGMSLWFGAAQAATLTDVYDFCSQLKCADGGVPTLLTADRAGNLYGVTLRRGSHGPSAVFELTPADGVETVLYDLPASYNQPSNIYVDSAGSVYIETYFDSHKGDIFRLTRDKTGPWREVTLYSCAQNSCPAKGVGGYSLARASLGYLYGTAREWVFRLDLGTGELKVLRIIPDLAGATVSEIDGTLYLQIGTETGGEIYIIQPDEDRLQLIRRTPPNDPVVGDHARLYTIVYPVSGRSIIYRLHKNLNGEWRSRMIYTFPELGYQLVMDRGAVYGYSPQEVLGFVDGVPNTIYSCDIAPCPDMTEDGPALPHGWVGSSATGALYGIGRGQNTCGQEGPTVLNCGAIWELVP
jgi:hypothetical protein